MPAAKEEVQFVAAVALEVHWYQCSRRKAFFRGDSVDSLYH
jgi:hypothetical protein